MWIHFFLLNKSNIYTIIDNFYFKINLNASYVYMMMCVCVCVSMATSANVQLKYWLI